MKSSLQSSLEVGDLSSSPCCCGSLSLPLSLRESFSAIFIGHLPAQLLWFFSHPDGGLLYLTGKKEKETLWQVECSLSRKVGGKEALSSPTGTAVMR